MSFRRILPLLTLLALLVAPFGRMASAETVTMMEHAAAAAALPGHCSDTPEQDRPERSIDCMIACAAMAAADAPSLAPAPLTQTAPESLPSASFAGLNPAADPPPPRFS